MSQKFLSESKAKNVAQTIGPRLIQQNKANQAAEIFYSVNMVQECIDAFISVEEWTKAKKVAEQLDASLVQYVEDCYRNNARGKGDPNVIADYDPVTALEIYVSKGEWEEGLKMAEKQVRFDSHIINNLILHLFNLINNF